MPLAVDAFGLGCTLFAILSGTDAFPGKSAETIESNVVAGNSRVELDASVPLEAQNLIKGLTAADPAARPNAEAARAHPLFWTPQTKVQYLSSVGAALPVSLKRSQNPFIAGLEAAVDELIGPYDEDEPEKGGSWARELGSKYPIGGDWGKVQRPPEEDERNYFIYGGPPKKKQREARESLVAEGKPLGTHAAKEIRCVGLLKLVRNLLAHKTEHVESGRFESEAAIADYVLSSLPWLLMTVHTLDGEHKITSGAAPAAEEGAGASEEDRTLRMSFAANSERNLAAR